MVTKDTLVGDREAVVVVDADNRVVVLATIVICEVGEDGLTSVDRCVGELIID